ncbi:MAG: uroporphyrinogen-III synthase [Moraxella sp.]|nr:uroporphyrinogen-III synthase [Moraxella sp.]
MLFINTRPAKRTAALPALERLGFYVHELPLLTLAPRTLSKAEAASLTALCEGVYRLLVVVSITAVEYALEAMASLPEHKKAQLLHNNHTGRLSVVAVGKATAERLRQAGFVVAMPEIMSNEGMCLMPEVMQLQAGDRTLFWRGVGGRRLLSDSLLARGVAVDGVAWYERMMPPSLVADAVALAQSVNHAPKVSFVMANQPQQAKAVMLITSQMAYEFWQIAAEQTGIDWRSFLYVALGDRLCALIKKDAVVLGVHDLDEWTLATVLGGIQPASLKETS